MDIYSCWIYHISTKLIASCCFSFRVEWQHIALPPWSGTDSHPDPHQWHQLAAFANRYFLATATGASTMWRLQRPKLGLHMPSSVSEAFIHILVGGLEHFFIFSINIENVIIPTDFNSIIFQRGRLLKTTKQCIFQLLHHPTYWGHHWDEMIQLFPGDGLAKWMKWMKFPQPLGASFGDLLHGSFFFLVSGWWFGTMEFYDFPYIGNVIITTD